MALHFNVRYDQQDDELRGGRTLTGRMPQFRALYYKVYNALNFEKLKMFYIMKAQGHMGDQSLSGYCHLHTHTLFYTC